MQFCDQQQINKINPSLGEILIFLTQLHEEGLSYSAINTAKSMLSSLFEIIQKRDIGKESLIRRFMKGVFYLRPSFPKTYFTWDVKIVLKCLENLDNSVLTLRLLSIKLAVPMALTTGQRCQTLSVMDLRNIEITNNHVKIRIGDVLKQTKPKNHLAEIFMEAYVNPAICVVKTLNHYITRTESVRKDSKLFITTQKPFSGASKDTIARWIKLGLNLAGIDFSLHTALEVLQLVLWWIEFR